MRNLIAIGMILAFSNAASAQEIEGYLCIGEKATGFKFNETTKFWDYANFFAEDKKYIIKRENGEPYVWTITEFGEDLIECGDTEDFNNYGWISCEDYGTVYKFNKIHMRYIKIYEVGGVIPMSGDTPFIEIGTCAKL